MCDLLVFYLGSKLKKNCLNPSKNRKKKLSNDRKLTNKVAHTLCNSCPPGKHVCVCHLVAPSHAPNKLVPRSTACVFWHTHLLNRDTTASILSIGTLSYPIKSCVFNESCFALATTCPPLLTSSHALTRVFCPP